MLPGRAARCAACKSRNVVYCTSVTGTRHLLDLVPHPEGRWAFVAYEGHDVEVAAVDPDDPAAPRSRYRLHAESCPKRDVGPAPSKTPAPPPRVHVGLVCSICGRTMQNSERRYERRVGWARVRSGEGGGLNALRCVEFLGEIACASCVDALASGIDPRTQQKLLLTTTQEGHHDPHE